MNEEKIKWMMKNAKSNLLLSTSFSLFGMLLVFGLGFVFPDINPYVAIKWIVIVAAVVFAYSLISFIVMKYMIIRAKMTMIKSVRSKKTSKK
jgi:hypothetical protein